MKRWLVRICVFLLLGAIVNVAVAWAIGATLRRPEWSEERTFDSAEQKPRWVLRAYVQRCNTRIIWNFHGTWPENATADLESRVPPEADEFSLHPRADPPSWTKVHWRRGPQYSGLQPDDIILECACGWPSLSMRALIVTRERRFQPWTPSGDIAVETVRTDCLLLDDRDMLPMFSYRLVPLRPLSPGFAINTVFYAVVGWLLFAGPFVLRRRRRIRCGLCPKCAYDLRGSGGETCPECGAPVAPSTRAVAQFVERSELTPG